MPTTTMKHQNNTTMNATKNTNPNFVKEYIPGHRDRYLEETVRDCRILIDTCSLLNTPYDLFFKNAAPYLKKYGKRIIVPVSVVGELEKYRHNPKVANDKKAQARRAKVEKDLARYQKEGLLALFGEKGDSPVADQVFISVITRFRDRYNMVLITQDRALGNEVEQLNHSQAVRGIKKVMVRRINQDGYLTRPYGIKQELKAAAESKEKAGSVSKAGSRSSSRSQSGTSLPGTGTPFGEGCTLQSGKGALLPMSEVPQEGSTLTAEANGGKRSVCLGKLLGSGGEGSVYEVDHALVAKIYKPQCNTEHKRAKLELMLRHKLSCPGVCFPQALLYNGRHEFVGYLMPRAAGYELQGLFNKALMQKHFPDWKKADLVELCYTIMQKISFLHSKNILLGDINANNVLVAAPKEVYLVDTDSYQVEGYPCPVGKDMFTAPEIMGRNYADFLRTPGHERFSVAVLLFMILMLGKHPYSRQGGESPAENIRGGKFPYPVGEINGKDMPGGDWVYMWSHLSRPVKEAFYHSFQKGGDHYAEAARLTDREWLRLLHNYRYGLDGMKDVDPMSCELYPTRRKLSKDTPMITCKGCGLRVPVTDSHWGYCPACAKKKLEHTCGRCGCLFTSKPRPDGARNAHLCPACAKELHATKLQATCCDCGKSFSVSNGEYAFYESRNLTLPKRCPACRQKRQSGSRASHSGGSSWHPSYTHEPGIVESILNWLF